MRSIMSDEVTVPAKRNEVETAEILSRTNSILENLGFESHSFKVGWYNESVSEAFQLPYDKDCLAVLILSTPDMFENGFLPFLSNIDKANSKDPIDQFMLSLDSKLAAEFEEFKISFLHDFEIRFNRRPKILMQTAGHVSGAAYYYQASQVETPQWEDSMSIYGVSLHPRFGGWFAFRTVLVFEGTVAQNLEKSEPADILESDEKKNEVLIKFNTNWQDWTYRDVVPVAKKYSSLQREYFSTKPKLRMLLLRDYADRLNMPL